MELQVHPVLRTQSSTDKLSIHGSNNHPKYRTTTESLSAQKLGTTSNAELRVDAAARKKQRTLGRVQFVALCWTLLLIGWNDGSTGPLIPRIRSFYGVGFVVVSLIFVFACLGFLAGAVANMYINDKLGFGKTIVLGALCQLVGYSIQSSAPPFPAFIMAYTINGFGLALEDSQANGFVASLTHDAETKMGILHAAYGIGALASPLVATQFAQLSRWSFYYLVSLGVAVSNAVALIVVFKLKTQDECLVLAGEIVPPPNSTAENKKEAEINTSSVREVLRTKAVHLLAVFVLIYVGVEVTIGGWIVTFIIEQRHGGPTSGYISSGFYGGLTVGRVVFLWVNKKVGERRVLFIYTLICIGLESSIWFIPSLIGNAVAVSFIGMLLGPMYPIAMNHASRILPRWILTGSIGWIAGFGQAGSALLPFLTGAMASKTGIWSLQPLLIAMMVLMMALWGFVPAHVQRSD